MWSRSATFLIVRIKIQAHRNFTLPIPIYVVNELLEALEDLTWLGEVALRFVPAPHEESARKTLFWVKTLSPSRILSGIHSLMQNLGQYKGLDIVDVETGDVRVKVHLR